MSESIDRIDELLADATSCKGLSKTSRAAN